VLTSSFSACLSVVFLFFSKRNSLRESDWIDDALIKPGRTADKIIKDIPPRGKSALLDNAGTIAQQGSKYSTLCGLVVVCNYQNMIVLEFTTGPGNTKWNDITHPVKYLFSSGDPLTHKQLLIVALIYGMRKAGVMGPNGERSQSHNLRH
jgi:hypothetical protein